MPEWNADSRRLQIDGQIVKRFKWPAANQEAVLCAFEEEGWPERIDDPLPPQPEQDAKRRLADTIKCLNRKQVNELMHFRGDGTGEGVVWERHDTNGKALQHFSVPSEEIWPYEPAYVNEEPHAFVYQSAKPVASFHYFRFFPPYNKSKQISNEDWLQLSLLWPKPRSCLGPHILGKRMGRQWERMASRSSVRSWTFR
ncbi:hypothetical protein TBK1r_06880 [Stieleria magnilauensis]|uniref:Uncharacterized protein n=2 Tax=Stieleria magnilauensis TaxID=2527963 RepID=A0ABX5XIF1_9BACT|nr:hypothetical protein TBK1r_06880 [Planctomycetes bacterium TBK1r]